LGGGAKKQFWLWKPNCENNLFSASTLLFFLVKLYWFVPKNKNWEKSIFFFFFLNWVFFLLPELVHSTTMFYFFFFFFFFNKHVSLSLRNGTIFLCIIPPHKWTKGEKSFCPGFPPKASLFSFLTKGVNCLRGTTTPRREFTPRRAWKYEQNPLFFSFLFAYSVERNLL